MQRKVVKKRMVLTMLIISHDQISSHSSQQTPRVGHAIPAQQIITKHIHAKLTKSSWTRVS